MIGLRSLPGDNLDSYFIVKTGLDLEGCKAECVATAGCKGVEHHESGRCEIWSLAVSAVNRSCVRIRPEGIGSTSGGRGGPFWLPLYFRRGMKLEKKHETLKDIVHVAAPAGLSALPTWNSSFEPKKR